MGQYVAQSDMGGWTDRNPRGADHFEVTQPLRLKQIAAGEHHTCGILMDDTVFCWGSDSQGESSPSSGKFTSIVSGTEHNCGI